MENEKENESKNLQLMASAPIPKAILTLAIPTVFSTIISLVYNLTDTYFIGLLDDPVQLGAISLAFPVFLVFQALGNMFGAGAPSYISRCLGAGKYDEVRRTSAVSVYVSVGMMLVLTVAGLLFMEPIIGVIGTSSDTIGPTRDYLRIVMACSVVLILQVILPAMLRAEGKVKEAVIGMMIGTIVNIVLDPVFIFVFGMGVSGAALATILSQAVSAAWVLRFLFSAKSGIRIRRGNMKFEKRVVGKVIGLGIAPFIMQSTESLVNITLNAGLQRYGGDLYVGSMTIMQSVMQMLVMPIQGITQGAQPIMSYNYGAKNYSRVRKTFSLLLKVMLLVTVSGFALAALLPGVLARMFTQDAELIEIVKKMMPIFFGGIWAFGAQMACQTTFMALGQAKISLFLALLRKVVLLVPLALLLPVVMGGNVLGIYIAEPVADVIASFTTLSLFLIKRKTLLPDGGAPAKSK